MELIEQRGVSWKHLDRKRDGSVSECTSYPDRMLYIAKASSGNKYYVNMLGTSYHIFPYSEDFRLLEELKVCWCDWTEIPLEDRFEFERNGEHWGKIWNKNYKIGCAMNVRILHVVKFDV
jgi:hypothetical protein